MRRLFCLFLIVLGATSGQIAVAAEALVADADHGWLFLPRGPDGLTVFDTGSGKVVALPGTRGAVGVALVPRYDRLYVASSDGTLSTLALSTLTLIRWQHLDSAGLTGLYYDAARQRLHALAGVAGQASAVITLDAGSGALLGRTELGGAAGAPPDDDDD